MADASNERQIIDDGRNTEEALKVLASDLPAESLEAIRKAAARVIALSVDPIAGPPAQRSDGLLYGPVQSGKTGALTVSAAMAADNGFQGIIVLTSDKNDLYDQTVERVRKALRGVMVLGKKDWKDSARFGRQLRTTPFAIVCSKNGGMLTSLLDAFKKARAKGLSLFLVDDEADQASLDTNTRRKGVPASPVNRLITQIRDYFPTNTFLQVTATPQALFLQTPGHLYRPSFTVLTEPGPDYIGGNDFFGPNSKFLVEVDIAEVASLSVRNQPNPSGKLPSGLKKALCTFLVGATAKLIAIPDASFSFLCHVSLSNKDHDYIVGLIDRFKDDVVSALSSPGGAKHKALMADLQAAHLELATTEPALPSMAEIEKNLAFYMRGASVKLLNAQSSDDISLDGALNFFVGGNKLSRGVTIRNLLVSYYGRNPRRPNADTVLQHARMYGYRKRDVSVTRLFLPHQLADNFRSIHEMEAALRELIRNHPDGRFEGMFVRTPLQATRNAVVDPASLGVYVAGSSINPRYPLRSAETKKHLQWIDTKMAAIAETAPYGTIKFDDIIEILKRCTPDPSYPSRLYDVNAIHAALEALKSVENDDTAYLVVRRKRKLTQARRETQGIIDSTDATLAPNDKPTLFLFRQEPTAKGEPAVWWPQLRFPVGNFVIAFGFKS